MKKNSEIALLAIEEEIAYIIKKLQSIQAPNYKETYYCVKVSVEPSLYTLEDILVRMPYPISDIIESVGNTQDKFLLICEEEKVQTDQKLRNEQKAKKGNTQ